MNICFVVLSVEWGGAETVVYELARHLRDKGIDVSIILNQETLQYYADLENVELFNIGSLYRPKSLIPHRENAKGTRRILRRFLLLPNVYLDELFRYRFYRKIRGRLLQFLSNKDIDVISTILEDSVPLVSDMVGELKTLRISSVAILGGEGNLRGLEPTHPLFSLIVKWKRRRFKEGLRKVDRVVGPTYFVRDAWQKEGVPLEHKYTCIPNGVRLSEIQDNPVFTLRQKGEFNLLFPGGSKFIKGGDLLLQCLSAVKREIPTIHVHFAGEVPQGHKLRKMVKALQLEENVTFAGFLWRQEYRNLLHSVDLLVMPSREEAFGIVYLEAMALGKPVIATSTGGAPEVIKDGRNGILVEPEPNRITDAILYLYKNKELRERISQNNTEDAANYDWGHIAEQYIKVYKDSLKKESHSDARKDETPVDTAK